MYLFRCIFVNLHEEKKGREEGEKRKGWREEKYENGYFWMVELWELFLGLMFPILFKIWLSWSEKYLSPDT